ncbi:TonB-dependent hemin, ferrichrome receptor [plant metagenome]|uniref:TonB-dependent hemin, ferrichrome receptor n=1 Tax=plant metagenome TaxID=1297885 RepID=A0A484P9X9_9ZZZZ
MRMVRATFVIFLLFVASIAIAQPGPPPDGIRFDIAAQPAPAALNQFARQADITLLFAYDAVKGLHTPALQGVFTVEEGLARLLAGTPLVFARTPDGVYVVRHKGPGRSLTVRVGQDGGRFGGGSGGFLSLARLHGRSVTPPAA